MSKKSSTADSPASPVRVCIVDDDQDVGLTLKRVIDSIGAFEVRVQTEKCDIQTETLDWRPDIVFTDLVMPEMDGFAVIREVHAASPETPVIVLSAYSSLDNAVRAIKEGAFDFLAKPFDPDSVELVLTKAVRQVSDRNAVKALADAVATRDPWLAPLMGGSAPMQALRDWIVRVRGVQTNILIQGETGTGKELVARAIHGGHGPFVPVNVAAIPADLAESEFFGHRQGAFTGAAGHRPGLLAEAQGGTLFLDEINGMDLALQAKLLRVIQEHRYRPVGANQEIAAEFSLICATNEPLEQLVEEGRFRRDLYHRIKVLSINLPPLRQRQADIPILAQAFLERFARQHRRNLRRISAPGLAILKTRPWNGNIRELENVIEQAVIFADDAVTELDASLLRDVLDPATVAGALPARGKAMSMAEMQAWYANEVLMQAGNNKSEASRILDIDYKTLLRHLNRHVAG